MRILVTGASGRVGREVVKVLHPDHEVIGFDRAQPPEPFARGVRLILGDHERAADVYGAMGGSVYGVAGPCDAVIHLSAIPAPGRHPEDEVFRTNIMATWNICEAATLLGVKRIVFASSINVLGFGFRARPFNPEYLPIDEQHPHKPQDSYSLSKVVGEDILHAFTRKTGIPTIAIRPSGVVVPDEDPEGFRRGIETLSAHGALWTYSDRRDLGQAFRLAVESSLEGFEAFYIMSPDPMSKVPLAEAFPRYYPGTEQIAAGLTTGKNAVSIEKARRLLGYNPQHSWRTIPEIAA
jgi:nucleoside-diphosphate-sugar epimerase